MNEEFYENVSLSKDLWELVLNGDRQAFNRITEPYINEMSQIAEHEILYHEYLDHFIHGDLNAEELVGEALLWAWRTRRRRPEEITLRAWLMGTLKRVIQRRVKQETLLRKEESISLESPVPSKTHFDEDKSYWDWHQPDDFTKWEDIIRDHDVSPEDYLGFEEIRTS